MKVAVGTKNKRKIETVQKEFKNVLPDETLELVSYPSQSLVSETPWDKETPLGAKNRALDCKKDSITADYYIGIESGLVKRYGQIYEEAWACIVDKNGKEYYGYSSGLKVPNFIIDKMDALKMKHWEVMKLLEDKHALSSDDTWGNYSHKMLIRDISLQEAIRNALIQIFAPKESFYHK